ncbi:hypothetical protein OQA88_2496 [Cercophora sp. LCS_1]
MVSQSLIDTDHPELRFLCHLVGYRIAYASTHLFLNGHLVTIARAIFPPWFHFLVATHVTLFAFGQFLGCALRPNQEFAFITAPGDCVHKRAWWFLTPAMCVTPALAFLSALSFYPLDETAILRVTQNLGAQWVLGAVIVFYVASQHIPQGMALCHYLSITPVASMANLVVEFLLDCAEGVISRERTRLAASFLRPSPMADARYTYQPAQHGEIRLLELARTGDSLRCRLIHVKLDGAESLSYWAISYRWGPTEPSCNISIHDDNGHQRGLNITRNAFYALEAICPLSGTRFIWMDSICIDQAKEADKAQQIPLMNAIYSKASQVVAHVGVSPHSTRASDFTHRLAIHALEWTNVVSPGHGARHRPYRRDEVGWDAVKELMDEEYWSRVWMIQELCLAKRVKVVYGDSTVSWWCLQTVKNTLPWWKGVPGMPADGNTARVPLGSSRMYEFRAESTYRRGGQFHRLTDLMLSFRHFRATKPQDRINALLALISPAERESMGVVSEDQIPQINMLVASHALRHASLNILSMTGLCHRNRDWSLPSWVPDALNPPMFCHGESYDIAGYNANGGTDLVYEMKDRILEIEGFFLDKIEFHCPIVPPNYAGGLENGQMPRGAREQVATLRPVILALSAAWAFCRAHCPDVYPSVTGNGTTTRKEAFWRTMIADFDGKKSPVREEFSQAFDVCVTDIPTLLKAEANNDVWTLMTLMGRLSSTSPNGPPPWMEYYTRLVAACKGGRQFGITSQGYMGLFPAGTKDSDELFVLKGARVPFVLREHSSHSYQVYHQVCGDGYLHGFMNGEALGFALERVKLV